MTEPPSHRSGRSDDSTVTPSPSATKEEQRQERLRSVVVEHHALVWRSLRRFGAPERRVDEAVSRVFDVVHRKLDEIEVGKEKAFVIRVCELVGSEFRRAEIRFASREAPLLETIVSDRPSPEEHLEKQRARALLDEALDTLDPETRTSFVLHEIEQWTMAEIAECLGLPAGTVASRLRRGREQFARAAERIRERLTTEREH